MNISSPSESIPQNSDLHPISLKERIAVIDIIRGIAIFGILLINIKAFSFPENFHTLSKDMFPDSLNRGVEWFLLIFIEGKFYSLFSFLFGLGMAVQYSRAVKKGVKFGKYFTGRMFALLAIALVHDIFIWNGMILICYAMIGFILIPFKNRQQKTLQRWIIGLIVIPLFLTIGTISVIKMVQDPDSKPRENQQQVDDENKTTEHPADPKAEKLRKRKEQYDQQIELFRNGSYSQQLLHRVKKLPETFGITLGLSWYLLAMFLMGVWAWREGIFQDIEKHKKLIKKSMWMGLVSGIILNGFYIILRLVYDEAPTIWVQVAAFYAKTVLGNIAFCVFYIGAITLMLNKMKQGFFLNTLAAVGRTALSNYLFQSIVGTFIFYHFGLGLFGFSSPVINLLVVVTVFVIQMLLSSLWTDRFKFGPAEWLWRSMTYGKLQPMRKE